MVDDTDSSSGGPAPESLLPYDLWTEEALRHVVARALTHAAEAGLPGEHHFYVTFRTDWPGVVVPPRLRAQYPHEMTIVLQHQFWGLNVDAAAGVFTVGLSFGGVPSTLRIPLIAVTAFADPHVRFGLRFRPPEQQQDDAPAPAAALPAKEAPSADGAKDEAPDDSGAGLPEPDPTLQVVSLDAFRRRAQPKDSA
jgi:hypothetical protein